MARPRKTAAQAAPSPPPLMPDRSVNVSNKRLRGRDLTKIFNKNSNKVKNPRVKLDAIIKKADLKAMGWKDREITLLRRYTVMQNEYNNIKRAYDDTIGDLKEKNATVIEKISQLAGNSVLLNESLLINVIQRKSPSSGLKADALAERLQDKFGDVLAQYNINLEAIMEEMKQEAAANQKYITAMEIGRQDYTQHFQSFRRNRRNSLKEFDLSNWFKTALNSFLNFFSGIAKYLNSLFSLKSEAENILVQLMSMEENVKGNIMPYARLYENSPTFTKKLRRTNKIRKF
jgi:hypothetical protein